MKYFSQRSSVISGDISIVASSSATAQFATLDLSSDGSSVDSVALPNGIGSFADLTVDPTDEQKVFALSTTSQQVCSFLVDDNDSLTLSTAWVENSVSFRFLECRPTVER